MMQGSLAMRLRVLRAERGLSLTEAAERAGIQRQTLAFLERGERHPHDPTLAKLAKAYEVPVEDLLEEPVPLAKAPLLDPSDEEASGTPYMKMPAAEFDGVRLAALTGQIDGSALRAMLLHEYNAAERAYKRLKEAGASADDLERAKDEYREARKRWTVALFDDVETTIALDDQRDANVVEREDIRLLPLDKAYDQIRGVVQALTGPR